MKNFKKILAGLILAGTALMIMSCGNNAMLLRTYKVTYSLGEGVEGTAPTDSKMYLTGQTVTLAAAVERNGYTFTAWNDGKADYVAGSNYTMGSENVTFIAQWKKVEEQKSANQQDSQKGSQNPQNESEKEYSVTYSLGEGVEGTAPVAERKYKAGEKFTLAAAPVRENYTFSKWNNGLSDYSAGTEYTMGRSDVTFTARWTATNQVELPSFSVVAGEIQTGTTVTISCGTPGATIYYTTDGSTPTTSSTVYSLPISVDKAMTIKAIAVKSGMTTSTVASAVYTMLVYKFTSNAKVLPAGTDGSAGTSATYVEFGDWPQTIMAAGVTVDENDKVTMGMNTYYKGSDGNYYAKCLEHAYGYVYKYSDGTDVKQKAADSYRYFKVEPIKWRVLSSSFKYEGANEAKLLMSESILTSGLSYHDGYMSNHRNGAVPNNYEHSYIRAYLNGIKFNSKNVEDEEEWKDKGFLQTAFTITAQEKIKVTTVDNSKASTSDAGNNITQSTNISSNTKDKVFFLSENEVTTATFGFAVYDASGAGNTRIRTVTDFAKANNAHVDSTAGYGGKYMLRSPHYSSVSYIQYVNSDGDANKNGMTSDAAHCGVVPAMVLGD